VHAGSSGSALLDEHGQLIGLVISGVALGGQIGVGLNEFLGIDDAWRAQQVEPQISTMDAASLIRRETPLADRRLSRDLAQPSDQRLHELGRWLALPGPHREVIVRR